MNAYWAIASVDAHERFNFKLPQRLQWTPSKEEFIYLLAKPLPLQVEIPAGEDSTSDERPRKKRRTAAAAAQNQELSFGSLPAEIILSIFDQLDFRSCLNLMMTSKKLFSLGATQLARAKQRSMAPWAGSPIMCWGSYNARQACPGLCAAKLPDMIERWAATEERSNDEETEITDLKQRVQKRKRQSTLLKRGIDEHPALTAASTSSLPSRYREKIQTFLSYGWDDYYPATESWILRNLTLKQFVRGDRMIEAIEPPSFRRGNRRARANRPDFLGFREIVIRKTGWSPTQQGGWVGHRIEICVEKEHAKHAKRLGGDGKGDGDEEGTWRDITEEMIPLVTTALDSGRFNSYSYSKPSLFHNYSGRWQRPV